MGTIALTAVVFTGFASAACGGDAGAVPDSETPSPGETSASPPEPGEDGDAPADGTLGASITLVKSGGFAGVVYTVEIDADGAWTYTEEQSGADVNSDSGDALDDAVLGELAELLADPDLSQTAKPDDNTCADMFVYTLTVTPADGGDALELRSGECGEHPNEVFTDIVDLISEATPLGDG
ncbi:MAG: hypothetical protein ACRDXX_17275 [Stackebrandtia sp.]